MKDFAKKALVLCSIFVSFFVAFSANNSSLVFADETDSTGGSKYHYSSGCRTGFLGFNSWDCGVDVSDQESLETSAVAIAANVALDISIAASYLVIGYVIYGGYLYTFSSGDPAKVAAGKKTLAHAFVGLAIAMSATVIIGSIRVALIGGGDLTKCVSEKCIEPSDLIGNLIGWVTGVVGVVSAVFLVSGGIQYISASGDPGKVKRAKDTILYSLIGLAIVALAAIITAFVSGIIRDANNSQAYYNDLNIVKEIYENKIT